MFGWAWKKTRKAHLIVLLATAASWFILGIWYGWGYCPLTDWHWDVKERSGETNLPNSFVKYMGDKLFLTDLPSETVDKVTLISLVAALLASLVVNLKAKNNRRRTG